MAVDTSKAIKKPAPTATPEQMKKYSKDMKALQYTKKGAEKGNKSKKRKIH